MARAVETNNAGVTAGAWINVVLGLAIAAIPFFTAETGAAFWNNIVVGLLIAILAGYNAWAANNAAGTVTWAAIVNVVLGIWLVIAPFLYGVSQFHLWADVILGVLVALIAGYNAWASGRTVTRVGRPGV